jgi:hypothetical protein
MDVEVSIKTDQYPDETTWNLSSDLSCDTGSTINGGPYSQADNLTSVRKCLPAGKYVFTIKDSAGDGLCCGYGIGWYNIVVNGVTTHAGGLFGGSETKTFGECTRKPTTRKPTTSKPRTKPTTTRKPTKSKPNTKQPTRKRGKLSTQAPTASSTMSFQPSMQAPTASSTTSFQPSTQARTESPTTSSPPSDPTT